MSFASSLKMHIANIIIWMKTLIKGVGIMGYTDTYNRDIYGILDFWVPLFGWIQL